jgi:hypothetical protein
MYIPKAFDREIHREWEVCPVPCHSEESIGLAVPQQPRGKSGEDRERTREVEAELDREAMTTFPRFTLNQVDSAEEERLAQLGRPMLGS